MRLRLTRRGASTGPLAREALLVLSRELYPPALRALARLVRTKPDWLDLHLVGFDPERTGWHEVEVEGEAGNAPVSLRHRVYGWDDVGSLGLPPKMLMEDGVLAFVPGNMDWLFYLFDRDNPGYDRIWWVEDDVRFGAPWRRLFRELRDRPEGLIAPRLRRIADDPEWTWWWTGRFPDDVEQLATFHPFGRLTHEALRALVQAYREGWKGHHETFLPTVVHHAGLGVYDPVDHYTRESFRYRPFHESPVPEGPLLWHPVRGTRDRKARWAAFQRQREAMRDDAAKRSGD